MDGVLTSAILVPEHGPPVWERPLHIRYPDDGIEMLPMEHWLDCSGSRTTVVEMDLARHAAQPVGHPARRRHRRARRRLRRTGDRRRQSSPTSCCTTSHRTGSGRCGRRRRTSARAPTATCSASRSVTRGRPGHRGRGRDRREVTRDTGSRAHGLAHTCSSVPGRLSTTSTGPASVRKAVPAPAAVRDPAAAPSSHVPTTRGRTASGTRSPTSRRTGDESDDAAARGPALVANLAEVCEQHRFGLDVR